MKEMSRRNFLGAIGAMGAMGAVAAVSGCAPKAAGEEKVSGPDRKPVAAAPAEPVAGKGEEIIMSDGTIWRGTPEHIAAFGGSTMPLEELNRRRKAYVDAQTEWVNEDGSVVPACYVKMRALIHTHGFGAGEGLNDAMFKRMQDLFTEEQVEAYLEMPWGETFTVNEYYHKCQKEGIDRTFDECKELCELFSEHVFLPFRTTNEGLAYNIPAYGEGVATYSYCDEYYDDPASFAFPIAGDGMQVDQLRCGTPVFYSVPLNREVVAEDSELLAYDDVEAVIKSHEFIAVQPCSCRYEAHTMQCHEDGKEYPKFGDFGTGEYGEYRDEIGERIETCLALGDDAEFIVSRGLGRRVDQDYALKLIADARKEGYIFHCLYGKEHAWLCMCSPSKCWIMKGWQSLVEALGPEEVESQPTFIGKSHYTLEVDFTKCIACGTCMGRCPGAAITMDGKGGTPQVTNHKCYRCGQCAYVCPQGARILVKRPDDEILELPHLLTDDYNQKAAYRFEHDMIGRGLEEAFKPTEMTQHS